MNYLKKYISLSLMVVMGGILLSCGSSVGKKEMEEEKMVNSLADSIAKPQNLNFNMSDSVLAEDNFKAFEQRAVQKLEDLADYLKILSDTTVDIAFKEQARDMALKLFISPDNKMNIRIDNNENSVQTAGTLFKSIETGSYGLYSFDIINASVNQKLEPSGDFEYKGSIFFKLLIFKPKAGTSSIQNPYNMQCEIKVKKVQKEFGSESKLVWEVYLGNISSLE
jgi:hypothetical protein